MQCVVGESSALNPSFHPTIKPLDIESAETLELPAAAARELSSSSIPSFCIMMFNLVYPALRG